MNEELRNRIVKAFKRGADGYGGIEGGAQEIIDALGLTVETRVTHFDGTPASRPTGRKRRVVGKWEAES